MFVFILCVFTYYNNVNNAYNRGANLLTTSRSEPNLLWLTGSYHGIQTEQQRTVAVALLSRCLPPSSRLIPPCSAVTSHDLADVTSLTDGVRRSVCVCVCVCVCARARVW